MDDLTLTQWHRLFLQCVQKAGMTRHQLDDAVMHCIIEVKQYGNFQIADVTGWKKKFHLISGYEFAKRCGEGGDWVAEDFEKIYIKGRCYRIKKTDVIENGIDVKALENFFNANA